MGEETASYICPLDFRYGRAEVRELFSRAARLERALRVEAALAQAEATVGLVPADAARAIDRAVEAGAVSLERVDELEAELKHDVMAISRALAEAAGPAGAWVHLGATSADITETALALELRDALTILRADLTELARTLADQARRHRATPQVSRTHGQHAVPQSFGYKMAVAAAEVLRQRRRLDDLSPRVVVGKMSGAVGTGASFGEHAERIEDLVMERLDLAAEEAPTQLVGRDRIAELTNFLALLSGTTERLATEVRNLQRTEIGEVQEAFDEGAQVGSSTMAQKRNPMLSENVSSISRFLRALALPALENMVQWHERDLANSANERFVLPHALVLADDVLTKLTDVFRHLDVRVETMRKVLADSPGAPMTEGLMLALVAHGVPRGEAHEALRGLTRGGVDRPATLAKRAHELELVTARLSPEEIDQALDPARYVAAAAAKTDRVLARLAPELSR